MRRPWRVLLWSLGQNAIYVAMAFVLSMQHGLVNRNVSDALVPVMAVPLLVPWAAAHIVPLPHALSYGDVELSRTELIQLHLHSDLFTAALIAQTMAAALVIDHVAQRVLRARRGRRAKPMERFESNDVT